jgi:DNA-binding transcriptional regulator GbsR (MarR family)
MFLKPKSLCSKKLEQIIFCCKKRVMTAFSVANISITNQHEGLDDWETAVIDLFLNAANSFGLPKSYGQIYGLLFCRDQSLSMDEVMKLLQISKGSASQGLRALRQLGAVSSVFESGDRKERFVAEIRLRKLVGGFLREQADPHLDKGVGRLKQIESLINDLEDVDARKRGVRRHEILSGWHRQMSRLLPWVKMIVGKSDRLPKKSSD